MEMPTPGPEQAQLARLAGRWEGREMLSQSQFDPQGGTAVGRYRSHMALHDFYLLTDYEQEFDGVVRFRGHGVTGWDARARRYVMFWFDSTGFVPPAPATGTWDGNTLTLEYAAEGFGHGRYVWILGNGEMQQRIESSPDGKEWATFLDGKYTRTS